MSPRILVLLVLVSAAGRAAPELPLADAIRKSWSSHPGLRAGESAVEAAREQAQAAGNARLPVLTLGARALRTDEPMTAFGLKLDQGRINQADFDPARLNSPDAIYGWGLSASLTQPLYAGGRIDAGRRAAAALADASGHDQERRRQEIAEAVVEAYFGSQLAEQGVRFAEDKLAQARETETFVHARAKAGAMLDADAARATAFRAQSEAELETARQRLGSARSALSLLVGEPVSDSTLTTRIDAEAPAGPPSAGDRPDLLAARERAQAADAGASAAGGNLLPEVFLQLSAETARRKPEEGTVWTTALLGARWQLSLGSRSEWRAAQARARAATDAALWEERRAAREVTEARRALDGAAARIKAAREAVASGEAVRTQRAARHRQGLLPLTEVLDAETGLSGARTLLLQSQLEARLARAQLQLALGQPVEGVTP
ncbi:MAG TPA: TolC family protein [Myxococcales bacterium]|nr:TolC family protein [Myxococcales bacterium]